MKKGQQHGDFRAINLGGRTGWAVERVSSGSIVDLGLTKKDAEAAAIAFRAKESEGQI